MNAAGKKPEIVVFAGPNGSGKSTITNLLRPVEMPYINADDIQRVLGCDNLEAAKLAEAQRESHLEQKKSFCFETVLSTERNLKLLQRARENGFFIRCYYVLTVDPAINVARVQSRVASGGHDVPPDKIIDRYDRALRLVQELVPVMCATSTTTPPRAPTAFLRSGKSYAGIAPRDTCGTKRILWP